MNGDDRRARVVTLAREWLGTPYRHQARLKGVGCDCTFLAALYEEAGIIPAVEIGPYSPAAHLHRTSGVYLATVLDHAHDVAVPAPGDVALYMIGRDWSHGAVVVAWPEIIHADMRAGAVVLAKGDQGHLARAKARRFFSFVQE